MANSNDITTIKIASDFVHSSSLDTNIQSTDSKCGSLPIISDKDVILNEDSDAIEALGYSDVVHMDVKCDGCSMYPIFGMRYKCYECPNFDLCNDCKTKLIHNEHRFKCVKEALESSKSDCCIATKSVEPMSCSATCSLSSPTPFEVKLPVQESVSSTKKETVHLGVECCNCHCNPVVGLLYKCTTCPSCNLCSKCMELHDFSHELLMIKSYTPPVVRHVGISCDVCKCMPIVGIRYKCTVCNNYDLCSNCINSHDVNHPVLMIKEPKLPPPVRRCDDKDKCSFSPSQPRSLRMQRRMDRGAAFATTLANIANTCCQNVPISELKAKFVAHVTYPEKTIVAPSAKLIKTWKVQNIGTIPWPEGCTLGSVGGFALADSDQNTLLPSVSPQGLIDISIEASAPLKPGRYTQYFRLTTPELIRFGNPLWIDITVDGVCESPEKQDQDIDHLAIASSASNIDSICDVMQSSVGDSLISTNENGDLIEISVAPPHKNSIGSVMSQIPSMLTNFANAFKNEVISRSTSALSHEDSEKYSIELKALESMGFADTARNSHLLNLKYGNVQRVIEVLLTESSVPEVVNK